MREGDQGVGAPSGSTRRLPQMNGVRMVTWFKMYSDAASLLNHPHGDRLRKRVPTAKKFLDQTAHTDDQLSLTACAIRSSEFSNPNAAQSATLFLNCLDAALSV